MLDSSVGSLSLYLRAFLLKSLQTALPSPVHQSSLTRVNWPCQRICHAAPQLLKEETL